MGTFVGDLINQKYPFNIESVPFGFPGPHFSNDNEIEHISSHFSGHQKRSPLS